LKEGEVTERGERKAERGGWIWGRDPTQLRLW
jgi:hypothetical protein